MSLFKSIGNAVSSGVNAAKAAAEAAAKAAAKAAADAAKKAAAESAKKTLGSSLPKTKKPTVELTKRKDGFEGKNLDKLTKNYTADKNIKGMLGKESTTNKDGSITNSSEKTRKGTVTREELTTKRNKYTGQTEMKYENTATTKGKGDNFRETKAKFEAKTDLLGRGTSTQSKDVTIKKGDTTTVEGRKTDTAQWGVKNVTDSKSTAVEKGNVTTTDSKSVTRGAFNTRQTVTENKVEVKNGEKSTVTTTSKDTKGTSFNLSHTQEYKDGKFTLKDSADWKKNSFNKEVGKEKEWKLKDAPKPDSGFTQKDSKSKLDKAQKAGDLLGAAGVKKEWKGESWDTAKLKELDEDKVSFAGVKKGTSGESSLSIGANGVDAKFKREASAGVYAQHNDSVTGAHGTASYKAGAKLEAKATVDGQAKLNLNGLDASVNAKVGVSAEASVSGKLESNSLGKIGGVDIKVGAEGTAKVSAELEAHATGTVKITRNPPAAIAEGSVGASAVAKAEAEVKLSGGPFSVKASGYASAGAEAKASGVIGYQDGKLKIGGSAGAALGLGLGGSVQVEVDVKQIGEMAKNTAVKYGDQNGDGKLGLDDVSAGAKNAYNATASTVSNAAKTVRSWLPW